MKIKTDNIVVIGDLHSGCKTALCPSDGIKLDEGGVYKALFDATQNRSMVV